MGLLNGAKLDEAAGDFYHIREQLAAAPRPRAECRSNIVDFYKGRSVLITGASGFIGKVMVEKLLRTCPDIKRVFVLIRPKWDKRPDERLAELLACPLFDGVRACASGSASGSASLAERVIVVEGDVTQQNLGLSGQNLLRLTKEVSVVFHSAATVKFDEPLKQSIGINIAGTKGIIEFCRRCPQLAGLVHVSTAYANCDRDQVDEHVYPLAMDPERLIQMADWLDLDTMQELKRRLLGARPNTYTYTKALAEWLIVRSARDLPVVICRPSIVVASKEEPFKGWIDNVNGPTGVILGAGKGLLRSMYAETSCVADLVPVDKVINLVLTLGWFAHLNKNQKHLNESAESFTESLLSGGPSSVAGSSSANSTNGGDDPPALAELEQQQAKSLTEAARSLFDSEHSAAAAAAESKREINGNNNNNNNNISEPTHKTDDNPHSHHRKQRQLAAGSSASSGSPLSSPSLSGGEEEEEEEEEEEDDDEDEVHREHDRERDALAGHLYATTSHLQRRHRHRLSLQRHHQDDGYGSRSDYANSISSSSDSSSMGADGNEKRRDRRHHASNEKPVIRISSISESGQLVEASGLSEAHNGCTGTSGSNDDKGHRQQHLLLDNNNHLSSVNSSELECKLKQFRHLTRAKLIEKELPEELADVPVFHCTSGGENSITWGRVQLLVIAALTMFPSISTYRYPCGSFTNNKLLDDFYRLTLHYIPGLIADTLTQLAGGKPIIVKVFKKFDQAATVLKAFTTKQWDFEYDNRLFLMNELMNDEDRRLFNFEIKSIDWEEFISDYVVGVKKFLLKEPMSNNEQARKHLNFVYYRNLALQVLFFSTVAYCMASTLGAL